MEGERADSFVALQEAHAGLTDAYVRAHNEATSMLIARPIVDDHIRRKISDLRDAYTQARVTSFSSPDQVQWLDGAISGLADLGSTFRRDWAWKKWSGTTYSIITAPAVGAALAFTGVTALALALLNRCLCHLTGATPMILTLAVLLILVNGFYDKRNLFTKIDGEAGPGVYAAENAVFDALGFEKPRERALDVTGLVLITAGWVVAGIVGQAAIKKGLFVNPNFGIVWVFAGIAAVATIALFIDSRRRIPA